jgi:hypothetical protein
MPSLFKIGATLSIYDFLSLTDILPNIDIPVDPDWSFKKYSTAIRYGRGHLIGQGFPIAVWRWNHFSDLHREVFRELCPDLSADMYIKTPTNETEDGVPIFKPFSCIMNWMTEDEDKQINRTLGVIFTFTHLVEVIE